jgi:hypothetical protein
MKVNRLIHLIIFLLALNRITIGGEIEYFRHVEIDNLHAINTRYQIDSSIADTVNCFKVEYDGEDRIERITYMKDGLPANQDEGKWSGFFIKREKNSEAWWYEDVNGTLCFVDTNLALMVYSLENDSVPLSLTDYDEQGEITEDSAGVAQYVFETDESCHVIRMLRLNAEGDTITDNLGYYETQYGYSENEDSVEMANYGTNGRLSNALSGSAIMHARYDSLGNSIEIRFFDENKNPVIDKLLNAATVRIEYDKNGYISSMRRLDTKARPMPIDDDPWPRLEADYSDRGKPIEFRYYGQDEVLKLRIRNNQQGKIIEQCFFGPDGELRIDKVAGFARFIVKYDESGNDIESSYQGPDSQLVEPPGMGYARVTTAFDKNGNPIENRTYGSDNELIEHPTTGSAIIQWDRDIKGRITEVRSLGADGKLKDDIKAGTAIVRIKYDKLGNEIEKATYGADGKLKNAVGREYSISRFKYDDKGRITECSAFGPDEKPVLLKAGYSKTHTKYDRDGNLIEDSYYGTDGKLIIAPELGFARAQYKYDENGNFIEDSNFGAENEPIVWSKGGYFKSVRKYDSQGRLIEACFYDVDGSLMEMKGSDVAVIHFKYDADGNLIEKIMFDKNMNVSSKTNSIEDLGR